MSAIIFDDEPIIPDEVDEIEQKLEEVSKSKKPNLLLKILHTKQYEDLTDEFFWYLIVDTWVESELNHQQKDVWRELFALRKAPKHFTQDLPDKMYVFRGGNPEGISWTLSNEQGQWFAERFGDNEGFWGMEIKKEDVRFYTNLRGEEEVVIIPRDNHLVREIGYIPKNMGIA